MEIKAQNESEGEMVLSRVSHKTWSTDLFHWMDVMVLFFLSFIPLFFSYTDWDKTIQMETEKLLLENKNTGSEDVIFPSQIK